MNKSDTYNLISNVISLLNSDEFAANIPAMAKACNVPLPYMRQTLLRILGNTTLSSCIDADNYTDPADPEATVMDTYYDDPCAFSDNLLAGKYDNLCWDINLKILDEEDQILSLSSIEYGAMTSLGETPLSLSRGALYEKKGGAQKLDKEIADNLETIEAAIESKQAVHFTYKDSKGTITSPTCFPTKIITNVVDNWIYFNTTQGHPYRLDRVASTIKILKDCGPFPDFTPNPYEKYIWGSYYSEGMEPEHVKLRIIPSTNNLIRKIKNDTRHRQATCKLYHEGDYFYYEDDIIGIEEFHRWLRSYGSSIQVIEPAYLQEKIKAAAEKTLDNYSWAEEWKDL